VSALDDSCRHRSLTHPAVRSGVSIIIRYIGTRASAMMMETPLRTAGWVSERCLQLSSSALTSTLRRRTIPGHAVTPEQRALAVSIVLFGVVASR
jgi:hypothetical protein